jgi:arsenate reductase
MGNTQTVIYYNPKCSKCRMTLELLKEKGSEPEIVEYLNDVPSKSKLKDILTQLGLSANQLLRKNEPAYQQAGLSEASTEDEIINAMAEHSILIERPIVVHDGKAAIGRPPEKVLEIL